VDFCEIFVATHIFDVWARMDCDDVSMLDTEVVANHSVDASTSIIEIVIGENDQDCVLALLSLDQYCVAPEQLQRLHCVV